MNASKRNQRPKIDSCFEYEVFNLDCYLKGAQIKLREVVHQEFKHDVNIDGQLTELVENPFVLPERRRRKKAMI
jgi:hypothetical protein